MKHHETLLKHCKTSQNTQTLTIRCDDIGARCREIGTWRGDIGPRCGDFGVCITPQMCNRVTNHGDMGTFSKPEHWVTYPTVYARSPVSIYSLN